MILHTPRLTLRPQAPHDAPALFAMLGDAETMRFWGRPPIARLAVVTELVREQQEAMAAGLCRYWTLLEGEAIVGSIDLSLIAEASAELGFVVCRARWGAGLASEAVAAVAAHGLGPMGLKGLAAAVQTGNDAARRVLVKNDFKLRESRAVQLPGGLLADCAFYVRQA